MNVEAGACYSRAETIVLGQMPKLVVGDVIEEAVSSTTEIWHFRMHRESKLLVDHALQDGALQDVKAGSNELHLFDLAIFGILRI